MEKSATVGARRRWSTKTLRGHCGMGGGGGGGGSKKMRLSCHVCAGALVRRRPPRGSCKARAIDRDSISEYALTAARVGRRQHRIRGVVGPLMSNIVGLCTPSPETRPKCWVSSSTVRGPSHEDRGYLELGRARSDSTYHGVLFREVSPGHSEVMTCTNKVTYARLWAEVARPGTAVRRLATSFCP